MIFDENYLSEEEKTREKERIETKLAEEITQDYLNRREDRRSIESGWLLNLNFFSGNQYCDVSPFGGVVEEDPMFYWQARRVFNHIAPTIDSRIAKLEKMKPELTVRAFSDEDGDVKAAKLATGILKYVQERIGLNDIASKALMWSETCGSVFYKITWDEKGGRQVAVDAENNPVYEGEAQALCVVPALAFDSTGNRLGYGKGFYDRFLINFIGLSVGITFDELKCNSLPHENTDISVDIIITDKEIILTPGMLEKFELVSKNYTLAEG